MKQTEHLWVLLVIGIAFMAIVYSIDAVSGELVRKYLPHGELVAAVYFVGGIAMIAFLLQGVVYLALVVRWLDRRWRNAGERVPIETTTTPTAESDEYECTECGTSVTQEASICPKCGSDLSETIVEETLDREQAKPPMSNMYAGMPRIFKTIILMSMPMVITTLIYFSPIAIQPLPAIIALLSIPLSIYWIIKAYMQNDAG